MKIALLGYGKMGKEIEKISIERGHSISVIIDKDDDVKSLIDSDVAINFSTPSSAVSSIKLALDSSVPIISGTTGWLEKYNEIVENFNLSNILNQKGRELSGGQRRRVEIARCLVATPKIILMDEPFAGIDPIAVDDIKKILNQLVSQGISILITDHNVGAALEICSRALILSEGNILAEGSTDELIKNAKVREVYLGEMYS